MTATGPVSPPAHADSADADRPRSLDGDCPRLPAGVSVLLVDDRPRELRLLGELLRRAGARVLLATDGTEGERLAREQRPGVLLLEVALPPTDGFEVCRRLKADPATAEIPVLFLSGRTEPETMLRGFAVGGQDYIAKPFNEAVVLARVALHLDLIRRPTARDLDLHRPGEAPPWLTDALALLQDHLEVTPTLAVLAHRVGTNPRRLNETFHNHLGQTVFGFLREARLKEARRLLVETRLAIAQVAAQVGYPQAANFATAFRERYGVSPRQLRRDGDAADPAAAPG